MAKKKAAEATGVNKSELIRQKFAELGWDAKPKQIIEALKSDGVEASYPLVAQIKVKHAAGGGKKRGRPAATATISNGDKPDTDYSGTGGRFDFPPVTPPSSPSSLPNVIQVVRQIRELAKACGGKAGLIELINELA
jgi:hypothetical protein